jgi:hypothetical protein
MKCRICDAELVATATYCHECGGRVAAESLLADQVGSAPGTRAADAPSGGASPATAASSAGPRLRRGGPDELEQDLWRGGYSAKAMIGWWIAAALGMIVLVVGGMIAQPPGLAWLAIWGTVAALPVTVGLVSFYRRLYAHYRLTDQRFYHARGVLRRVTDRMELIDIDDISHEQTLFERLCNVGTIHITSNDRSHPELVLHGIEDVAGVAKRIDIARRAERVRRGLFLEPL